MNDNELDSLIKKINVKGLISTKRVEEYSYNIEIKGKSLVWKINLNFKNKLFPYGLPKLKLLNKDLIGQIPHVNILGTLCLIEDEGLLLNSYDSLGILKYLVLESVKSLEKWKLKIFQDELEEEIEGYFQSEPSEIHSFYEPGYEFEELYLETYHHKKKGCLPILLHSKNESLPMEFSNLKELNKYQRIKIFHIPLYRVKLPPENGKSITIDYLNDIFSYIEKNNIT